jgi:hyaluronoglucosaminidase
MCPTDYHGRAPFSAYTHALGEGLHPAIGVYYTGADVCVPAITAAEARAFGEAIQRQPLIWDNYPVNDLAMAPELHLGPVRGRDPALAQVVAGVVANPMNQPEASKVPLLTYAEYLANPRGYDPDAAWERALRAVAGRESDYAALRLLGEVSLKSCMRVAEAETLRSLAGAAQVAGERGEPSEPEAAALEQYLVSLDEAVYHLRNRLANLALRADLLPWLEVLEHWAWLGRRALEVLSLHARGEPVDRAVRHLRESQAAVTAHPKRLGGDALLPLAALALQRAEGVPA